MAVARAHVSISVKTLVASLTILLLVLLAWMFTANACIDPSSQYAFEVVLNKPGIDYNYTVLENLVGQNRVLKTDDSVYVFKYRYEFLDEASQLNVILDFVVVLYREKFSGGAPYIEGISDPSQVDYYPAFRLELASPPRMSEEELEPHVGLAVFHFLWFLRNDIVVGLAHEDVSSIARRARLGYAGWNNRLVYYEGLDDWAPYSELVNKGLVQGLLVRGNACSMQIPKNIVNVTLGLEPLYTAREYVVKTTMVTEPEQTQKMPVNNGILVAIAITIGAVAGLLTYLYTTRKQ